MLVLRATLTLAGLELSCPLLDIVDLGRRTGPIGIVHVDRGVRQNETHFRSGLRG